MPETFPFVETDGGRKASTRSRQTNDCTVRAITVATGLSYDEVYDILADLGRKCSKGWGIPKQFDIRGYRLQWQAFQAVKGERRMNPVRFCREYPKGRYIGRTAKHVFAVIDGTVYDLYKERDDRCIYGCWSVKEI